MTMNVDVLPTNGVSARKRHTDTKSPTIWDNKGIQDCSETGPVNVKHERYYRLHCPRYGTQRNQQKEFSLMQKWQSNINPGIERMFFFFF